MWDQPVVAVLEIDDNVLLTEVDEISYFRI